MREWDDEVDETALDEDPIEGDLLSRVEEAYRAERARIRATSDVSELCVMRDTYLTQLGDGTLRGVAAIRGNDLVELIDERITDLKAARRAEGP